MAATFPEARFIHVVRDGRDVALAFTRLVREPVPFEAAYTWRRFVEGAIRGGRSLGPTRYREVRYENLVADPERELRHVCDFIDLRFDETMLRYFERADEVVADAARGKIHSNLSLPPTRGLRDWRSQMERRELVRFELLNGRTLERLGYERSGVRPRLAERAVLWRLRLLGVMGKVRESPYRLRSSVWKLGRERN